MQRTRSLGVLQAILLIFGLMVMLAGAYAPTLIHTVNAYVAGAIVTVTGSQPTSISLGAGSFNYLQCPTCTTSYQEVQFGNALQLSGRVNSNTANLQVSTTFQINTGNTYAFLQYSTDSQGYYGSLSNGGQPADLVLIQLKPDGIYISSPSGKFGATINVGDTVTFKAKIGSVTSNAVKVKIVGSGVPPTGTVTLKGGDGKSYTLDSSSNIQTLSPLCFQVKITQGLDNIQSMNIYYWVYNSQGTFETLTLTKGSTVCGLPSDSSSWYGQLSLQPATYVVKVNIIPKQGQPIVLLSIIGYIGVTPPEDVNYWIGAGLMMIGAVITTAGAYMPVVRRRP